jgi:hypothetical protein
VNEERARALALIRESPANHERFFSQLQDASWLEGLEAEKFFTDPPGREQEDDWVRFPNWAESQYLVRVAAQAPEQVARLALGIRETDNVRVHGDILAIGSQLPGKLAKQIAAREAAFLAAYRGPMLNLADQADSLAVYLLEVGEVDAAYALLGPLLRIHANSDQAARSRQAAVAIIDAWQYARTLERVWPKLAEADPKRAFGFLCERLADVIRIGFTSPSGLELAGGWRPAIEANGQNLGNSLLDALIDAVRDGGEQLAEAGELDLALAMLAEQEGTVFERISAYLIRLHGSAQQVREALLDRALADERATWHEYSMLMRDRFGSLGPEERRAVLEDIEAQAAGIEDAGQARYWRFRRLNLIASALEGEELAAYENLAGEFAAPENETFTSFSRSWTGPRSPFGEAELAEWEPERLLAELTEWEPGEGFEEPTPEGLARTLEAVIGEKPEPYAQAAARFTELEPTYVRALLGGLTKAAKEGRPFAWPETLSVGEYVIAQPREASDAEEDWDRDRHWGAARKQLADLLEEGLSEGEAEIEFAERDRVWALLAELAEDPDPDPERETYGEDSMDPATRAINSVRGEAIFAVFRYLLWVERREEGGFGAHSVPEAVSVLDRHLDPEQDPSLAIRAAYGQWFSQLVRIERGWAEDLAPRVFPADPEQADLFAAAWDTYVLFTRPYAEVLDVLEESYTIAIRRLADPPRWSGFVGDPVESLGQHLIYYAAFEDRGLEEDGLLARFWREVDETMRETTLSSVGWGLEQRTEPLPGPVEQRFQGIWERAEAEATPGAAELAAFGSWLGASVLDGSWLLARAKGILERGIHLQPNFAVFGSLARLAADHPKQSAELVGLMAETDKDGWAVSGSEDEAREVLRTALAAGGEAAACARGVIDLLGASGLVSFGDLLSG